MAIAPAIIFGPLQVSNVAAALYTSPVGVTTVVNRAVFTNVSAGAVGLTVWVVRSGGTAVNSNILIGAIAGGQSLTAGPSEPYVANSMASLVLAPGDAIWARAASAASINAVASGWTQ